MKLNCRQIPLEQSGQVLTLRNARKFWLVSDKKRIPPIHVVTFEALVRTVS